MARLGWIEQAEAEQADQEALLLQPRRPAEVSRFPYFTEEVKRRLLDDPSLGETATDRYNALFRGGLRIYTTVDPLVQESAELAVASVIEDEVPYAAVSAVDPRTGHVLALVGGRDFYDTDDPVARFNLATQGSRQPGSAFKPFVLASALEEGLTLESIFEGGSSITVDTDSGPWTVDNYNNANFPDLSLLEATVFSVNVVYAQVVDLIGPEAVVEVAPGFRYPLQPATLPLHCPRCPGGLLPWIWPPPTAPLRQRAFTLIRFW